MQKNTAGMLHADDFNLQVSRNPRVDGGLTPAPPSHGHESIGHEVQAGLGVTRACKQTVPQLEDQIQARQQPDHDYLPCSELIRVRYQARSNAMLHQQDGSGINRLQNEVNHIETCHPMTLPLESHSMHAYGNATDKAFPSECPHANLQSWAARSGKLAIFGSGNFKMQWRAKFCLSKTKHNLQEGCTMVSCNLYAADETDQRIKERMKKARYRADLQAQINMKHLKLQQVCTHARL